MEQRNIFIRFISAFGWLVLVYFSTNIIIGAIVGGIAGSATNTYEEGYIAGENASIEFFQDYGLFVIAGQLVLFLVLAITGMLPGTTKYKRSKKS